MTEFTTGISAGANPYGIAAGPDGNLWFTENDVLTKVGRITPSGTVTVSDDGPPKLYSPRSGRQPVVHRVFRQRDRMHDPDRHGDGVHGRHPG